MEIEFSYHFEHGMVNFKSQNFTFCQTFWQLWKNNMMLILSPFNDKLFTEYLSDFTWFLNVSLCYNLMKTTVSKTLSKHSFCVLIICWRNTVPSEIIWIIAHLVSWMYDECLLLSEWRTTYEYDVLSFVIYAKTRCFVYHKTPLPAEFVGFSPADGSQKKEETKMDGIDSFTICLHSPNGR